MIRGVLLVVLAACAPRPSDYTLRPGVESVSVLDADPGEPLTLFDADDQPLLTVLADALGQAHFAYVPKEPLVIDSREGMRFPFVDGHVLRAGDGYEIRNDDAGLSSGPFRVLAVDDVPDPELYDRQVLDGIHTSPLTGDDGDPQTALQYVETRDGTLLSVMVRFPDPLIYGEGPWPTVIEYSGYSPSRPDRIEPASQIANALGFATVGVNMRGTGCSGGVFDVFNPAQQADGYDVVEAIARQDWVLDGKVGMVGISYPGISQLFVAATNPPSLGAVVPLSTIGDSWEMQWPGGIYNEGFTKQWVDERDHESASERTSWVSRRIEAGDTTCADNTRLSSQNIDFETFLHGLEVRPADTDARDLTKLVRRIETAVFLAGQWQDEQTGAQFGAMLDRFDAARAARFLLANGRHPDGLDPDAIFAWHEFLRFYLVGDVPTLNPLIRSLGASAFADAFGMESYSFPADRFEGRSYDDALAAYEAEQPVRVLFEVGAGSEQPGSPIARYEARYDAWPPAGATPIRWSLDAGGALAASPGAEGADAWTFDTEAATRNFFGPSGYQLLTPLWDVDWSRFESGKVASYVTAPFEASTVLAGPGVAELWVNSPVDDTNVQVTLTEVRPDGVEVLVSSGWLRLAQRGVAEVDGLRLHRDYDALEPLPHGEWARADLQIPSFAHAFRAGSRLRMSVSAPGRDHGTWRFEPPAYESEPTFLLGRGGAHASALTLTVLPGITVPEGLPPCPSLRGQPCREYEPVANVEVE